MNSARALQLSGSGTQIHSLFDALCRALLVIMQIYIYDTVIPYPGYEILIPYLSPPTHRAWR